MAMGALAPSQDESGPASRARKVSFINRCYERSCRCLGRRRNFGPSRKFRFVPDHRSIAKYLCRYHHELEGGRRQGRENFGVRQGVFLGHACFLSGTRSSRNSVRKQHRRISFQRADDCHCVQGQEWHLLRRTCRRQDFEVSLHRCGRRGFTDRALHREYPLWKIPAQPELALVSCDSTWGGDPGSLSLGLVPGSASRGREAGFHPAFHGSTSGQQSKTLATGFISRYAIVEFLSAGSFFRRGAAVQFFQFGFDQSDRFRGRPNSFVVRCKCFLVNGNLREKLSRVKIVLRISREPYSRPVLIPLLLEMAALVNLPQKNSEGNIVRHVPFNPCHLPRGIVKPNVAPHLRKNRSHPARWLVVRIWLHPEFRKHPVAPRLLRQKREDKSVLRLIDQLCALFLFLLQLFISFPLLFATARSPVQCAQQFFKFAPVRSFIHW